MTRYFFTFDEAKTAEVDSIVVTANAEGYGPYDLGGIAEELIKSSDKGFFVEATIGQFYAAMRRHRVDGWRSVL
ncbi:hypothetical protein NCPPB3778_48 [Rathayibacter phage NCPPB3778]|nr:hypothetical protein NCPPB3778_48 [Rathayibacter phage NCPPB3778]